MNTPAVSPSETLLSLIDAQVQNHPMQLALQDRHTQLTYGELTQRANRLAHAIRAAPDTADSIIGILLAHGVNVVTAMLGAVKAGRAYVYLEPGLPAARLAELCADAGVRILITDAAQSALASELAQNTAFNSSMILLKLEDTAEYADHAPEVTITPSSPLALIYTSGSSGKPKGIMQFHGSQLALMKQMVYMANFTASDRVWFMSPFNVIAATIGVYAVLMFGGSLHLFDLTVESLDIIPKRLRDEGITKYFSTPTIFRYWASQFRHMALIEAPFPALNLIVLGGEAARSDDFELYKRIAPPSCVFMHSFGATEVGTLTMMMLDHSATVPSGMLPAGYILMGRTVMLLDENGQPVPEGEIGEIVVQVDAQTAGYWRDDEQSAAKFKPNPADPDTFLYFMGDLARIDEENRLIHLGRKDNQVKIRGSRIELGEIEAALTSHPAVRDAAALAVDRLNPVTGTDEPTLAAFIVLNPDAPTVETSAIRAFLHEHLPDVSIPGLISPIQQLPRVSGGKVDLQTLRKTASQLMLSGDTAERANARVHEIEPDLIALWKQALGVESIGMDDDFFALGGHSLLAAHLVSQTRVKFNLPITLSDFAEAPTLRGMLDAAKRLTPISPYLVSIRQPVTPMRPPLFCFPLLDGLTAAYWRIAQYLGEGQPVYAFDAQGVNSDLPPLENVEEMAALFIREMRAVQPAGPYFLYGYSFGGVIAFEVARQLVASGERVGFVGLLDTVFPGFHLPEQDSRREPNTKRTNSIPIRRIQTGLTILQTLITIPTRYKGWYLRRQIKRVVNRQQRANQPSIDNSTPLPDHLERIQSASQMAYARYVVQPYAGSIDYFFAAGRRLDRTFFDMLRALTSRGCTIREVSGSHFRLAQEPHVQNVSASLRNAINDALRALDS